MGKHRGYRRLLRRGGLIAAVVVLGVGVWQGVAGATATSGVTTKIQQHNANCGHSIGTPFIGTAKFSRDGNTINVKINLTNGTPDTEFEVTLWMIRPDGSCKEVEFMGFLLTDELGQGKGGFSADTVDPKQHKFFVDVASGIQEAPALGDGPTGGHNRDDNDSLIVKLA